MLTPAEPIDLPAVGAVPPITSDWLEGMMRGAKEFGAIIPFRSGTVYTHPDAVRDILVTNDAKLGKSPALRWARWTLGNGLLTADGPLHHRQRPHIQPTLHTKRLAGYAGIMSRHADDAAKSWRDGQRIDTHHEMMVLTLHIVAEALFGAALGPEVDAISTAMDFNVRAFRRIVMRWGMLRAFLPTPFTIRYLFSRRRVVGTMRKFIADRRASAEVKDDLLGRLIAAKTPDGKPAMSEQQLIDECVTLFAAGHETTANAMTFTLFLLANHPSIQAKLHQELDGVLTSDRLLTIDDVDRLPYTRQVISESMRLFPPAWIQGRQALQPCVVNGTQIKKGQVIFISQWLTHRDPTWWPNPDIFDPDRFAENAAERPRWSYFPFGGGSRSCIGEAFAWTEAVLVLATIARHWRFTAVPTDRPLELEPGITLRPKDKVELDVHHRPEHSRC